MLVRLLDRREVRFPIGDVQTNRQHRVTVRVNQILQRCGVACRGGDLVAPLQRCDRPLTSESARCTGDKPNFFAHAVLQRICRRPIPGSVPGSVDVMSRAALDKDPRDVASMFDGVARRYDLTNTVLSLGQDRYWRRATRSALRIGPGDKVLDLAAGTAVSTVELANPGRGVWRPIFRSGCSRRARRARCPKVAGDATRLPFADGVFDAVTISFGLRNVADHAGGAA